MGAAARVHYHAGVLWLLCLCLWPSAPCADGPHGGQAQKGSDVIAQQETRFHTSETRNMNKNGVILVFGLHVQKSTKG